MPPVIHFEAAELPPIDEKQSARQIPVGLIEPCPFIKVAKVGNAEELAASIRARGLLEPLLVRPWRGRYQLVLGSRRLPAVKALHWSDVPAIVREMKDADVVAARIVADVQHAGIHPLEEADSYRKLRDDHNWSIDQIAREVGKSRSTILGRLKLCDLVEEGWTAFVEDRISTATATMIARIPAPDLQQRATREILREGQPNSQPMTFNEASEHIRKHFMLTQVGDLLSPGDIFDCYPLRCRLTAGGCIARQDAKHRVHMTMQPSYDPCGTGSCEQGKKIRASVEAWKEQQATKKEQAAPPEKPRETERQIRAAAEVSSLLSLPVLPDPEPPATNDEPGFLSPGLRNESAEITLPIAKHVLKKPSRQTRAWMKFTEDHGLEGILHDPSFWASETLKVVEAQCPFDTEGLKLAALLAAAAELAVRESIGRTEYLRLATEFFDAFQKKATQEAA